jgi:hypothetical protein
MCTLLLHVYREISNTLEKLGHYSEAASAGEQSKPPRISPSFHFDTDLDLSEIESVVGDNIANSSKNSTPSLGTMKKEEKYSHFSHFGSAIDLSELSHSS